MSIVTASAPERLVHSLTDETLKGLRANRERSPNVVQVKKHIETVELFQICPSINCLRRSCTPPPDIAPLFSSMSGRIGCVPIVFPRSSAPGSLTRALDVLLRTANLGFYS